jgi:pyridoxamine 5'-phosphate oxidase
LNMPQVNPIRHFARWYRAAVARSPETWFDPTAMTLATSDGRGEVTARIVLLKKFGPEGFAFYTNYASRKGRQLSENPRAALVLHWPHLRRQVRIEGTVEQISHEEADRYFQSRPRLYQLSATISNQSEIIPSRKFLLESVKHLQKKLARQPVPRPKTWGGYRLVPDIIEFWQHRENRLHDRLRYRKRKDSTWTLERLAP